MKKCSKCGELKDFNMFYKSKASKDGRRPDCKACHEELRHEREKENPIMERCKRIGWSIITRTVTDIDKATNNCYKENNVTSKIGETGTEIGKYLYDNHYDEIKNFIDKGITPSVDRIDSTGDYEEGNIRIVSVRDNYLDGVKQAVKKTSKPLKAVDDDGNETIYKSVSEASRNIGIKRDTIIRNRDNGTRSRAGYMFYNI